MSQPNTSEQYARALQLQASLQAVIANAHNFAFEKCLPIPTSDKLSTYETRCIDENVSTFLEAQAYISRLLESKFGE